MPSANDVYITPASRKIEWYGSSAMKGQIHHDDTNFYVSGTLDLKLQGADDISLMGYSGGSIITFGTDQTERMRLTSDGKFGIGTNVPGYKLDVFGDARVKGLASHQTLELRGDTNYGAHINFVRNNGSFAFKAGMIENNSRFDITDYQGTGYEALSITSDLKVGIGNTSPKTKLTVQGALTLKEQAAADADTSDYGQIWVKNTAPNTLYFTDDVGTDHQLGAGGGGGGTIGGSITDNQVAFGASTANSIEGSANLTFDGTKLTIARTADATSRGISILDNEGTETISLVTSTNDHGLFYLRGATGGNSIYLNANGASYLNGGYLGIGTTAPDNTAEMTIVGAVYQDAGTSGAGNVNYGSGSFAHTSGRGNYGGSYSTAIGFESMKLLSGNAHRNTAVGYRSMFGDSTGIEGTDNTAVGAYALQNIKDGTYNVAIGASSGLSMTDGTNNTFVGLNSGRLNTTGNQNTAMGQGAMYNNVHGDHNTALGYYALHSLAPADGAGQNTALGSYAGYKTSTGHSNVYMGYLAGYELLAGERNVLLGNEAGRNATSLNYSTLIGNAAGYNVSGASEVIYIGRNSGYHITGNDNTFVGTSAGIGQAAATHATVGSVAVGKNAMYYNSTTNYCVAIGEAALMGRSTDPWMTGDYNTAVGRQALTSISSGYGNTALGYIAGGSMTTGRDNTIVGLQAGQYNTTGVENTVVGYLSGRNMGGGSYNTFMGWMSGYDNVGNRNTGLGYGSMFEYKQSGDGYNVAIGMYSMHQIETGSANVAIGYNAMRGTTGEDNDYNIAIGSEALYSIAGGNADGTVAIGHKALYSNTTASGNTVVGYEAGLNVDESHNTFIGYQAGKGAASSEGENLVGIGSLAFTSITTADNSVAIGFEAGKAVTTGDNQVMIGHQAGKSLTTGSDNVLIGYQAGESITIGKNNIAIGYHSMDVNVHGDDNIAIGSSALGLLTPADGGGDNVAIGSSAGSNVTTGQRNTIIGHIAGTSLTTGDGNVYIGHEAGPNSTNTDSNKLYINNAAGTPLIGGDFSAGEVTINASSKSITLDPYFVVSGDNQYSMISGSAGLALYGGNSYTDIWIDGQNSRQLRLRSVASDGSFDAGSFLEVFPSSVGATGDATANIRASSGDLYLYSVGSNNIALDSHHKLQMFFDDEYNIYSAADGNTRFTIRAASVAGMEFDGSSKIAFKNAASTKMTLDTAQGRLGIGTTSPSAPLHVDTTSTSYAAIFQNDSSNGYVMKLVASDSSLLFQTDHIIPTYNMHLGNDNVNFYMRTAGYKFGVGTSSPKTSMSLVGALSIEERADHETNNDGWGQLWVKNDSPNKLYFTDDAGTDHDLTAGGGDVSKAGTPVNNQLAIWTDANTIEGDANLTYDGTNLTLARTLDDTSRGLSIKDNEGTETIRLATSSTDQGLLYLRGATGGNAIYLDGGAGTNYLNAGDVAMGTTAAINSAKVSILDSTRQLVLAYDGSNYFNFAADGDYLNITANSTNKTIMKLRDNGNVYFNGDNIIFEQPNEKYFQFKGTNKLTFGSEPAWAINDQSDTLTINREDGSGDVVIPAGKVGIGTTAPAYELDISSTDPQIGLTDTNGYSYYLMAQSDKFWIGNSTAGTAPFVVDSAGKVGIGTSAPNQKLEVAGNITTTALDTEYRFANRSDLLIRGNASFDMELISPQDMAFGIDADGNETAHKFLFKTNSTTPSSAGTTLMEISEAGDVTIAGGLAVTGSTLAVQKTMKNDIVGAHTFSDSYSHYMATADNQDPAIATCTLTCPASPTIGDEYWITARCNYLSLAGGTSLVRITPNTSQTINAAVSAGSYITLNTATSGTNPTYKMAHLICVEANTWALTLSDVGPVA